MEIYSVRSSNNLLYKNNTKSPKTPEISLETTRPVGGASQTSDADVSNLDFSSMTPEQLRELARSSLEAGTIDQETFAVVAEGLPMHAIDRNGNLLDLTSVTDASAFDFRDYYESQLDIAMSIGDDRTARSLQAVVAFMNRPLG